MGLLINGVQLRPSVFHERGASLDRSGHRCEQIGLRLNSFAIALIGDVHRFGHLAIVFSKNRRC
ncbi:hypothetical protein [Mycobacterium sp. ITM-2016-00318]|uniref:hypothetical protein n=1 Tax=Mycobacterium sp. ITM-2016-00318 TaxID=2099693 RepID=UPI000CF92789|nr:hypothetical protein [Mycobacterium sp. ITM-2016-00318]WNG92483.1 hypothetical protein C6A82_024310 [Mycobacterium sp. ITM-2016-00318]